MNLLLEGKWKDENIIENTYQCVSASPLQDMVTTPTCAQQRGNFFVKFHPEPPRFLFFSQSLWV